MGIQLEGCPSILPSEWQCVANALLGPGARLVDYDLRGINLIGANLYGVSFDNVDSGANISGANLSRA